MNINPLKLAVAGGAAAILLGGMLSQSQSSKSPAKVTTLPAALESAPPAVEAIAVRPVEPGNTPAPLPGSGGAPSRDPATAMPLRQSPAGPQVVGGAAGPNNGIVRLTPPPPPPRALSQPPELKELPKGQAAERER